ncbi:MAG: sigma-54-dependent Fis family transcriptional regulator [Acidobacteriota bacterium]|nr:sigma-54-dependent Fis family transcriptional regulator [Acidobacteriota bacterium]
MAAHLQSFSPADRRQSHLAPSPEAAPNGEASWLGGNSAAITGLQTQLARLAPHVRCLLVRGESGSGKDRVVRELQRLRNATAPVVCVAPGTAASLPGTWQQAHAGTLYLDHIDAYSAEEQQAVLQWLHLREPASDRPVQQETLWVASTRADLRAMVHSGRFREDLFQRIAAVSVAVPPLRDRLDDLPELCDALLAELQPAGQRAPSVPLSAATLRLLRQYHWPGNVRELRLLLGQCAIESGQLDEARLRAALAGRPSQPTADFAPAIDRLDTVIATHVRRAVELCAGNKMRAAELLGISRSTLYRMLDTRPATSS